MNIYDIHMNTGLPVFVQHIPQNCQLENFILLLTKKGSKIGHYILVFRNKDGLISLFEPYGNTPKGLSKFKFLPSGLKRYLIKIADKKPIEFSEFPIQRLGENSKVCGELCCLRWLFRGMSNEEFGRLFMNHSDDEIRKVFTHYFKR